MGVKRVAYTVLGGALLLIGVALLVLPGPGLILVVAGLAILAKAFPRLERFLAPLRARAAQVAEDSVRSPWRLAGSIVVGAGLIAAGVVWGVVAEVPFRGWSVGGSLLASGVILFALLAYSYRQVHGPGRSE
ncbi:PGPGW domain-containing protein [Actinospica robiniae]|uniref:PGPGW domain-containing protein n=1 Tax=Actinospica robiniae TaxID=304901 RepID=UPI00040CC434|nr:PGPGW domain-containing protein [Actinospica robiniae]